MILVEVPKVKYLNGSSRIRIHAFICRMLLVTGANGFLGAWLMARLSTLPLKVKALRRESSLLHEFDQIQKIAQEEWGPPHADFQMEWVIGDILDTESLALAMEGVQEVIHTAALVSFYPEDSEKMLKVNAEGTANVVNMCLSTGVQRLLYVSSVSALGRGEGITDEKTRWSRDQNPSAYSISKHKAEMEAWRGMAEGLQVAIINPVVIHGPGDWSRGTCKIFKKVDQGMRLSSPGSNGWVDVRDVVEVMMRMIGEAENGTQYLLCGAQAGYTEYFNEIAQRLKVKAPDLIVPKQVAYLGAKVLGGLGKIFGFRPYITPELARTAYLKANYSSAKVEQALGFKFRTMDETLDWICKWYKKR